MKLIEGGKASRKERIHPDLGEIRDCGDREVFRVDDREFVKSGDGEYTDGKIVVYCDQQDSTSWAAKVGNLRTGYYWTPEYAVDNLLDTLEAAQ